MTLRRRFLVLAGAGWFGLWPRARARAQAGQRRLGFLSPFARADVQNFVDLMLPELAKLGWTEGRNLAPLELRATGGDNPRLDALASELVAQNPDVLLVQSTPATRALMKATRTIPIVMVGVGNPVELGIVADYRRPGSNVTGSSYLADESTAKMLQFLKEIAPGLRSVAAFVNPANEASRPGAAMLRTVAAGYAMRAQVLEVADVSDFDGAFAAIRREGTESILLLPEALIRSNRNLVAEFAQRHGLILAVVGGGRYLPPTGLIAYGPTIAQYAQLTARYVDRILKGAKPGDLPIEQPAKFELVINLKAARALGLSVPQPLLLRADEVFQ